MIKKFLSGLSLLLIIGIFAGCSNDATKTQVVTKPTKVQTTNSDSNKKAKLYTEDLKITQDEFVAVYNDMLKNLAKNSGQDYDHLKITTDDPETVEQTQNGATHFYSGERGFISIFRNSQGDSTICTAMITAKTNYKLPDMMAEVEALTQAATQKEHNFKNVMDFVRNSLQSQKSNATNIDGLIVSYNETGNYLTIIAEDAKVGNGFERMVDNIIDSAKVGGYWRN